MVCHFVCVAITYIQKLNLYNIECIINTKNIFWFWGFSLTLQIVSFFFISKTFALFHIKNWPASSKISNTHTYTHMHTYIYIYIFTNLISTSIHGTRKKKKKTSPGTRDRSISNHRPGEKEKYYRSKRKKRPTSSDPLKKIKGYAVSWSKEN